MIISVYKRKYATEIKARWFFIPLMKIMHGHIWPPLRCTAFPTLLMYGLESHSLASAHARRTELSIVQNPASVTRRVSASSSRSIYGIDRTDGRTKPRRKTEERYSVAYEISSTRDRTRNASCVCLLVRCTMAFYVCMYCQTLIRRSTVSLFRKVHHRKNQES